MVMAAKIWQHTAKMTPLGKGQTSQLLTTAQHVAILRNAAPPQLAASLALHSRRSWQQSHAGMMRGRRGIGSEHCAVLHGMQASDSLELASVSWRPPTHPNKASICSLVSSPKSRLHAGCCTWALCWAALLWQWQQPTVPPEITADPAQCARHSWEG